MCQSKENGGRRCPSATGGRANSLNAINKRLRRVQGKMEAGAVTGTALADLEKRRDAILAEKQEVLSQPVVHPGAVSDTTAAEDSLKRGLEQSERGEVEDLGDFTKYADDDAEENSGPRYDSRGFDPETGDHKSGYAYDPETGLDIDGWDYNGFDADGIHRDTGTKYDEDGYNSSGYDRYGDKNPDFYKPSFDDVDVSAVEVDVDEDEDIDLDEDLDLR